MYALVHWNVGTYLVFQDSQVRSVMAVSQDRFYSNSGIMAPKHYFSDGIYQREKHSGWLTGRGNRIKVNHAIMSHKRQRINNNEILSICWCWDSVVTTESMNYYVPVLSVAADTWWASNDTTHLLRLTVTVYKLPSISKPVSYIGTLYTSCPLVIYAQVSVSLRLLKHGNGCSGGGIWSTAKNRERQ